jgi:hypothetical protein
VIFHRENIKGDLLSMVGEFFECHDTKSRERGFGWIPRRWKNNGMNVNKKEKELLR